MSVRVAINGFGRIGRLIARHVRARDGFDLVAINDLTSPDMLGYLFAHDSVHGPYRGTVEVDGQDIIIDGDRMQVLAERDPAQLPWRQLGVEYLFEATGLFRSRDQAGAHIEAGARKVVITAPGKEVDETFVMGVNHHLYDPSAHHVVSNASCTTNCLAPMAKVIHETIGIEHGWLTTTHAYTNDQRILDVQHSKDMRRARAAAINIIPTSTGAAKAIGLVYPELAGKLDGAAMRVHRGAAPPGVRRGRRRQPRGHPQGHRRAHRVLGHRWREPLDRGRPRTHLPGGTELLPRGRLVRQ
jgi:glyceraldehyde 3-phosphate dehydrogenase